MAEFSVEVAGLQFEFLDGIRRWHDGRIPVVPAGSLDVAAAINLDVVIDPIKAKVILRQIYAHHVELRVAGASRGAGAGGQQSQGCPVPALQWHVVDLLLTNGLAHRCIFLPAATAPAALTETC